MDKFNRLILGNQAWASEKLSLRPSYFRDLATDQSPDFLWIGCSDSRVPAEEVTGAQPGEIFVHRNIANLVVHTDLNLLSVVQYAVDFLKVKHIIVCGHYGCGGIRAAMTHQNFGLLDKWLRFIKDTYEAHSDELEAITDPTAKADRLVELNVEQQIRNLSKTSFVQRAWKHEKRPTLHGWVFALKTGLLKPVTTMDSNEKVPEIFRFDLT